ncbi:hypothetical protein EKI60_05295 [Candidatus Saccharibacteria bacterium]|nr:MAG: hypothetical protein EKI60_05295 [Candidatus Saccharibacteria bacterium]
MDLGTAQQILVVILSSFLAIFLLLGIVATVLVIKVLKHVKHITEKAEQIADKAEAVSSFFQQSAGPAAIAKLISNIVHAARQTKK